MTSKLEECAIKKNIPEQLVISDMMVHRIARSNPQTLDELAFLGVSKQTEYGDGILKLTTHRSIHQSKLTTTSSKKTIKIIKGTKSSTVDETFELLDGTTSLADIAKARSLHI